MRRGEEGEKQFAAGVAGNPPKCKISRVAPTVPSHGLRPIATSLVRRIGRVLCRRRIEDFSTRDRLPITDSYLQSSNLRFRAQEPWPRCHCCLQSECPFL